MARKKSRRSKPRKSTLVQDSHITAAQPVAPAQPVAAKAAASAKDILAEREDSYRITLHRAETNRVSDDIVVTFAGQPGDIADAGFGTGFALSHGYDTIYVAQKHETHFQKLSADEFLAAVRPVTEGRRVVAYGSSLGAYAALYFGGAIGADIIAAAPLLPPWPSLRNPRYAGFSLQHKPLPEATRSNGRVTVLFDPAQRPDKIFMDEAVRPAYPDADYIALPHAGHTVLKTLQRAGLLSDVMLPLLRGEPCPKVDLPTEGFEPWHLAMGGACLVAGEHLEAERHGRAALAQEVSGQAVSIVTRSLLKAGKGADLAAFLNQELSAAQRDRFVGKVPALARLVNGFDPELPTAAQERS